MTSFPETTPNVLRQSNGYKGDRLGTSGSALETGNVSFTVGGGKPEEDTTKEVHTWYLLLVVIPVFTVFGNVLICLSVWREATLQTVTNYFIVSLAIADIMVAILVMPLAIYVQVNDNIWELGDALCDTWVAFDVMCCTASILNLTAISIDRFIAVTQPLRYARHKNSKRVYITLASTWVVSVAVSLPIAVGWNYTERRLETPWLCTFYNADFLIYSSMASFYIPCLLMSFLYYRTFRAILQQAQRKRLLKKKKMVEEKEVVVVALAAGAEAKGQGQRGTASRVSVPTQSTTDSEMSENSGSVCSVFEERVSRPTLLRMFSSREVKYDDSIGHLEGIQGAAGCTNECRDDGGNDAFKNSRELYTGDDGDNDEINDFTLHAIGRQSEMLWFSKKINASGSLDRLGGKTKICNRGGSDIGLCVLDEPRKHVSCDKKQKVADSSNTWMSTERIVHLKESNADSVEGKESDGCESSYNQGVGGYHGLFQPNFDNTSGELSETMHHERAETRKASMEIYFSETRVNSLVGCEKPAHTGEGKERRSWDLADSRELMRKKKSRKRKLANWSYPQRTLSSAGNDSRNTATITKEFLRDTLTFDDHRQTSPHASKILKEGTSVAKVGNIGNRETRELPQDLQFSSRGGPTKSSRPSCLSKRSRETWPPTTESLREAEHFTGIMSSAEIELHENASCIPNEELSFARGCQTTTLPSAWQVRQETSPSTPDRPTIVLYVREKEEESDDGKEEKKDKEEEEVSSMVDALSFHRVREDCAKDAFGGLTVNKNESRESQRFAKEYPLGSFDLSDNAGLFYTNNLAGSTSPLDRPNARNYNRFNASKMLESICSDEIKNIVDNELNRKSKEVRDVQNIYPVSCTRESTRFGDESGTKEKRTIRNDSRANDMLGLRAELWNNSGGVSKCRSTPSTRHSQTPDTPPEPSTCRSCHSCEPRPVTRDSLNGERIRLLPRDYSSHNHRAPAQQSISVPPARLDSPRAVCCRHHQALASARFDACRKAGPPLTARQRYAKVEVRVDGYQGIKSHVAPGREKREKVFTKRERKATTTLAIVLGVFLLCWVPFFTLNIVNAVCIRYNLFESSVCSIHKVAFDFFVWLGYFNSLFNPVIYTIFNVEFRKAFKRFFVEPCR